MSSEINADFNLGKAYNSKVKGPDVEYNGEAPIKINAGFQAEEVDSCEVSASSIRMNRSDRDELEALKHDFQGLLEYLSQNDITRSSDVATPAVKKELEKKQDLKQRLFNAFKAGGIEALKVIFEHPLVSISTEAIKAFLEKS